MGSKHQEEAWKWVKFLGSEEGQKIIAELWRCLSGDQKRRGTGAAGHEQERRRRFALSQRGNRSEVTFLFPIADHSADVLRVTKVAIDAILLEGS